MPSIKELYFDILNRGADLGSICELTSKLARTPVALTIPTRTIIARSSDYDDALVKEYTSSLLLCTKDEIKDQTEALERVIMCRKPSVAVLPYLQHKRINCGCFFKGKLIGVLDCPILEEIDIDEALKVIRTAAEVATIAMRANGYISTSTDNPMQIYLISLLNGNTDEWYQQKNLYNSALETIKDWRLVCIKAHNEDSKDSLMHSVRGFSSEVHDVWDAEFNELVVLLFNEITYKEEKERFFESCSNYGRVCVSDSYSDILTTDEHFEMCRLSIMFAEKENIDDKIIFVKNYKSLLALLAFVQYDRKKNYTRRTIESIVDYDREHGTGYFTTLAAYLLHKQNLSAVADKLYIHKNTVAYRIQRIEELFDLDIKDCRTITDLYLSTMYYLLFEEQQEPAE